VRLQRKSKKKNKMTELCMDKIAKILGAERVGKVNVKAGYFGALQLNADIKRVRYLERLAVLQVPSALLPPEDVALTREESQVLYDYCELRNYAKDLLRNPKDRIAERRLSRLIIKLGV